MNDNRGDPANSLEPVGNATHPQQEPPAAEPQPDPALLWEVAGAVPDPELPAVTLAELGVLRAVRQLAPGHIEAVLTPTYTGCPALDAMARDVEHALQAHGAREVTVRTQLTPPWSTDDITPEGRRKLAEFGIAPPRVSTAPEPPGRPDQHQQPNQPGQSHQPSQRTTAVPVRLAVRCPQCGSTETDLLSRFSATPCTALRRCDSCGEPFDHVKEVPAPS